MKSPKLLLLTMIAIGWSNWLCGFGPDIGGFVRQAEKKTGEATSGFVRQTEELRRKSL